MTLEIQNLHVRTEDRVILHGVDLTEKKGETSLIESTGEVPWWPEERRVVTLQQGIPTEAAKEIIKFIKDNKLKKVQAAIQADQVRVSSPSKDDLQEAMRVLREHDFGVALQFESPTRDRAADVAW